MFRIIQTFSKNNFQIEISGFNPQMEYCLLFIKKYTISWVDFKILRLLQKAPGTWYIVRKWDFMVKRQKVWFLISILTSQNDSFNNGIFSCILLKVWPLQQISGLFKIYMICSNMMSKHIFIMFWIPKTHYYSIMYI